MTDGITVMNATSSMGMSGLTNLSSALPGIGTAFGAMLAVGLILGAFASVHSWNTKGWLYRLVKWLIFTLGENVVYGLTSAVFAYSVYFIGEQISNFGASNPNFLYDMAWLGVQGVAVILMLAVFGYFTKPVYKFLYDYASGKKTKRASHD